MKYPTLPQFFPLLFLLCSPAAAAVYTFSGTPLTIQDGSQANPYPVTILVTGIPLGETVVDVDVTIADFSHTFPDDTAAVVGSPTGQFVVLFDGPGGEGDAVNQTWVFDDAAPMPLPIGDPLTSGVWQPSNEYNDDLPSPVPAGPYSSSLATFNTANPNGTWSLFVADYVAGDAGTIGGWSLRITTVPEPGTAFLAGTLAIAGCLRRRRA
jgi:subtilisin-like proprotein convertase family protein